MTCVWRPACLLSSWEARRLDEESLYVFHTNLLVEPARIRCIDPSVANHDSRNYWPKSKGAIIITSRRLINFSNHAVRTGQTIPTFNFQDGWELFIRSVGWEEKVANHELSTDELKAIEELVREFDGLPLSIDQAASLLTTSRFASAQSLLDAFRHAKTVVNPRPTHVHSRTNHAIDAIWHVVFESLGNPNARRLLSVLCLLSPDTTYVDVFQPKNQSVLTPYTEFLRRETGSVAQSSQSFRDAMAQLVDAGLIKRDGRILTIHRVVQEAFFFVNKAEHTESFFAVVRLVYDAFPKQYKGRPLHGQWERCERFIPEAISLCGKYRDFLKSGERIPYPAEFCPLLINSAWFLFEVGDYTEIFKILEIAKRVCEDKTSINYAHLQNIEGVCYFEFNNLRDCRAAYESAFRIRSLHLPEDDEELTDSTHNLGNLEHAEGNYQKALEHFDKARTNRTNLGDEAQVPLSLTVMGVGRTYESMKRYAEAAAEFEEAEGLILGAMGQSSPFMAKYVIRLFSPFRFPLDSPRHELTGFGATQSTLLSWQSRPRHEKPGRRAHKLRQGAQGPQQHHAHAPNGVVCALQGCVR